MNRKNAAPDRKHKPGCVCVRCVKRRARRRKGASLGRGLDVLIGALKHPPGPDGGVLHTIELSPQINAAVVELHRSGLFGISVLHVLEELVRSGVREAIRAGWCGMPRPLPPMPARRTR